MCAFIGAGDNRFFIVLLVDVFDMVQDFADGTMEFRDVNSEL